MTNPTSQEPTLPTELDKLIEDYKKAHESWPSSKPKCRQCLHPEEKGICTCDGDPFDKYKPKPERLEELKLVAHFDGQDLSIELIKIEHILNTLIRDYNERKGL